MDLIYLVKREMLRRSYSIRTINTYACCLKRFLNKCHKEPRKITKYDVKRFIYYLAEKERSGSTLNVYLQAIKFALEGILNKSFFVKLPYSKTPKKLPTVLSKEEVKRLFDAIKNPNHKLMVKFMYSAGLRVSELVNVKVRNLDFSKNYGWVRKGKGNKDRLIIIAELIKDGLINHIKENNLDSNSWLFRGRQGHITARSVQEIIKTASKRAKIGKDIHPHTLRHSFATHLIEDGYDVALVQSLLGHNSSETTMVYVHMGSPRMINVKSPLDNL